MTSFYPVRFHYYFIIMIFVRRRSEITQTHRVAPHVLLRKCSNIHMCYYPTVYPCFHPSYFFDAFQVADICTFSRIMEVLGLRMTFKLKKNVYVKLNSYINTDKDLQVVPPWWKEEGVPLWASSLSSPLLRVPQHSRKNNTHPFISTLRRPGPDVYSDWHKVAE